MTAKTLTTVLKTATATSVKLAAPADRIGLGLATVVATYRADALSPGHFPVPNPDSEPNPGDRQDRAMRMREHPPATVAVEPPAGPAGVFDPGSPVRRRPWSFLGHSFTGWPGYTDTARSGLPAASSLLPWYGSDCQSPDRGDDRRPAKREARPTPAAGK